MQTKQKLILFLLAAVLSFYQAQAGEDGITFSEKSWEEVQAQAKAENKFIFVDAFAVWCGPCKWMDKNVFTQEIVGEFFNENFISMRFDMEKGDGPEFARTYGVRAYPTFLFFDPDGNLVHRAVGGRAPEQFVEVGKAAIDPNAQSETLRGRYENGDRDADFLYNYVRMLTNTGQPTDDALATYLATQSEEDLLNEKNWKLIQQAGQNPSLDIFDFVAENKQKYMDAFGEEAVYAYLMGAFQGQVGQAVRNQNKQQLEALKEQVNTIIEGEKAASFSAYADFMFHSVDPEAAFPYAETYFDNYVTDPNEFNAVAWYYFENTESEEILKKALEWSSKSVDLGASYSNTDTKAHILYALGNFKEAIEVATESIRIGKEAGEDVSSTEELLRMAKEEQE